MKKAKQTPHATRVVYCLFRTLGGRREFAFEQRPATGRWAGMWQFLTRPAREETIDAISQTEPIGSVDHALTHRRYTFDVRLGPALKPGPENVTWHTLESSETIPLPRPHVKIRDMLRELAKAATKGSEEPGSE